MERAEVAPESTCTACGVEVRDGSLFCYNCGGAVGDEKAVLEATSYSHNGPGMQVENGVSNTASRKRRSQAVTKRRSYEPVKFTWKRDDDAGFGFLIIAIMAAVFAIGLLGIAYYLH